MGKITAKRTQRRRLERLGIPYEEVIVGWRGSDRWGWSPIKRLQYDECYDERYEADRDAAMERRAKAAEYRARKQRELQAEREKIAESLGLKVDSRTFRAYMCGEIEEDEARRIGEHTMWRHEDTDYDDLLASGWPKEDAREMMSERL